MANNIDIDELIKNISTGIVSLAKELFGNKARMIVEENKAFLEEIQPRIELYGQQLAEEQLTPLEFQDLVGGETDLLKLRALTTAGIALTTIDKFKEGVVTIISTSVFSALGL